MWIYLNDSFLSIVSPYPDSKNLLVRARVAGDIQAVFPDAKVFRKQKADYAYRAYVDRERVAIEIAKRIFTVDYPNFKDSVEDTERLAVYHRVWSVTSELDEHRDYFSDEWLKEVLHGTRRKADDPPGPPEGDEPPRGGRGNFRGRRGRLEPVYQGVEAEKAPDTWDGVSSRYPDEGDGS